MGVCIVKKIISIVLLFAILMLSASVFADTRHYVTGADIYLNLPDDFDVMTRDMEEDNPLIPLYGDNAEEVKEYMEENSYYFLGTDYDNYVVLIGMLNDGDSYNMSEYTDKELEKLKATMTQELDSGFAMFVEHQQLKFLKYGRVKDEQAQIGYVTSENGIQLMIYVLPTGAELTEEMEAFSDKVFSSIYMADSTFGEGWAERIKARQKIPDSVGLIFEIILIVVLIYICIVPMLIYRFGIRKRPVEHQKAKIIAAIIAIVMLIILGIAGVYSVQNRSLKWVAVICQFINYHIMVCGTKKYSQTEVSTNDEEEPQQQEMVESFTLNSEEDIDEFGNELHSLMVCPQCGTELLKGTKLCHNCGKEMQ